MQYLHFLFGRFGILAFLSLLCVGSQAQEVVRETHLLLYGNTLSYTGSQANEATYLLRNEQNNTITTVDYFGREARLGASLAGDVLWIRANGILYGSELAGEFMRCQSDLKGVVDILPDNEESVRDKGEGQAVYRHVYATVFPQFGYRLYLNDQTLDVGIGPEFSALFSVNNDSEVVLPDGEKVSIEEKRDLDRRLDARVRVQAAFNVRNLTLRASYARGLVNYENVSPGLYEGEAYTKVFRFGVGYRFGGVGLD